MADNNKEVLQTQDGKIKRIATNVNNAIDQLYKDTYFTNPSNQNDLNDIKRQMDTEIDRITSNINTMTGGTNMSTFFARLNMTANKDKSNKSHMDLNKIFNGGTPSGNILGAYMNQNRSIITDDMEIDTILRWMPKLTEALNVRKECVLSADHFTKEFLNISADETEGKDAADLDQNIRILKETYRLEDMTEEIYSQVQKYGEVFVYHVPYTKAITKLLNKRKDAQDGKYSPQFHPQLAVKETGILSLKNRSIVSESATFEFAPDNSIDFSKYDIKNDINISITINRDGMMDDVLMEAKSLRDRVISLNEMAVNEAVIVNKPLDTEDISKALKDKPSEDDKIDVKPNVEGIKDDIISGDGFHDLSKASNTQDSKKDKPIEIDSLPGSVVKIIDHKKVIPQYIDDVYCGGYYINIKNKRPLDGITKANAVMENPFLSAGGSNHVGDMNKGTLDLKEKMLKYLSGQISKYIDANFVNANQDLRKEIYTLLKENDLFNNKTGMQIEVAFIPAGDLEHVYIKKDPETNRGISMLEGSRLPAKIYIALYVTAALWTLTRGADKRVYYIEQPDVDTNVDRIMRNAIDQIKQGNFNTRYFDNIARMLNMTGRFQDFFIPKSQSGDPPIQFDVIPGQKIDIDDEFMQSVLHMAINYTGVPLELIETRQNSVDYALQLTMSNSKFLRLVYKDQSAFQPHLSRIFTSLYANEFGEKIRLVTKLSSPGYLYISNLGQFLDNVNSVATHFTNIFAGSETDDGLKQVIMCKALQHYAKGFINEADAKEILNKARQEYQHIRDTLAITQDQDNQ